jgi:TolB-like protein/tetratricopeptide (TPR) repeat protein
MLLYHELKRRNVFRVAAAYLASAWLLVEVAGTLFPIYGLVDDAIRIVVTLLAIGLPITLVLSWVYELTPEGLKLGKNIDRARPTPRASTRRLDRAIIVLLTLALGYFAFDKFVLDPQQDVMIAETAAQAGAEQALEQAQHGMWNEKSIAVLPFVNMSDDAGNEYFADGISEELLNLLTKIPELRVISRSSAFFYKGKDIKLTEVARELNVVHILEGSVRKAGNQVRITTQLIDAHSDTHLWSETYDRELDDIFAIQDEIAAAVVAQLKITLLGDAPTVKETDPQAYTLFLQGRHLHRQFSAESLEQAQELLQQALAIDPGYAAAWDGLGLVYEDQPNLGLRPFDEGYTLAREAVNKALAIDPNYALAHASLGWIAMTYENDLVAAARHFERALQLEPGNTDIIRQAADLTASLNRLDKAIALIEFALARDPVSSASHHNLGLYYTWAGRWDEAIASFSTALTLNPGSSTTQYLIGVALLFKGDPQAALEAMQLEETSVWRMIGLPLAYHALGQAGESNAALAALIEQHEQGWAYNIAYILAYRGEADRAFEWLAKAVEYKDAGLSGIVTEPLFANIHDAPRWLPFLESIGKSPEQLAAIKFEVTLPE